MYRRHGQKLGLAFLGVDLVATSAAWLGAYWLRYAIWPAPNGIPELHLVARALPTVLLLAGFAYRLSGLYEVHRLRELPRELTTIVKASGLVFLLAVAVMFYRRDVYETRLGLVLFVGLNALLMAGVRRAVWQVLKHLRGRGLNRGRALIVGTGRLGRIVSQTIGQNHWTGLEAIGFVDDPQKLEPARLPRLGTIDDIAAVVRQHDIDHVFVALPLSRSGELPKVYKALEHVLVEVQLVPDLPQLAGMRLQSLEIDGVTFLSLRGDPHRGWGKWAKRGMDLAVGVMALLCALPVMSLLAILIKLTSRGPVLFRQQRMGLGGRTFDMLKFRSMRVDAESQTGPVWARAADDRCTALGRLMRRWSLDELPQLLNVLRGDMSLVGPRPERNVFVEKFSRQIPSYTQRHQVKAGITGWAQVNGWRGNTSLRRRLECDLFYICNWSPWLDLQILWLTLWCGFRHRNAY